MHAFAVQVQVKRMFLFRCYIDKNFMNQPWFKHSLILFIDKRHTAYFFPSSTKCAPNDQLHTEKYIFANIYVCDEDLTNLYLKAGCLLSTSPQRWAKDVPAHSLSIFFSNKYKLFPFILWNVRRCGFNLYSLLLWYWFSPVLKYSRAVDRQGATK